MTVTPYSKLVAVTALTTVGLGGLFAGPALADSIYVAGTKVLGSSSTVSEAEALKFTGDPDTTIIQYPREFWPINGTVPLAQSVDLGAQQLDAVLVDGDTVYAVSQGAVVAHKIANQSDLTEVKLVTFGDPSAKGGLMTKVPLYLPGIYEPVIAHDDEWAQTNVVIEYDIIADTPDRLRPLALANAALGGVYYHSTYTGDMATWNDERVTITEDGEDTTVLVHTDNLPLVQPLRDAGADHLADALQKPLEKIVDSAYKRNDEARKAEREARRDAVKDKVSAIKDKVKERRAERHAALKTKVSEIKKKISDKH